MEETMDSQLIEGTVSAIIYQNEENGYTILRMDVKEEEMTVVGAMPGVSPGNTCLSGDAGCAMPPTGPSSRRRRWSAACPRA